MKLYQLWLKTCLQCEMPAISTDTAARIMAILYEYGNHEQLTHNLKFITDCEYIQERFGVRGSMSPDPGFCSSFRSHVKELQDYQTMCREDVINKSHRYGIQAPDWVFRLLMERYDIRIAE